MDGARRDLVRNAQYRRRAAVLLAPGGVRLPEPATGPGVARRRTATMEAAVSEAQLSAAIVELAELLGWRVFTVKRSDRAIVASRTGAGFPDLVMRRA